MFTFGHAVSNRSKICFSDVPLYKYTFFLTLCIVTQRKCRYLIYSYISFLNILNKYLSTLRIFHDKEAKEDCRNSTFGLLTQHLTLSKILVSYTCRK